ncbi:N-acetyltransferase ESCO2, partial [Bienertia sinuspersici]
MVLEPKILAHYTRKKITRLTLTINTSILKPQQIIQKKPRISFHFSRWPKLFQVFFPTISYIIFRSRSFLLFFLLFFLLLLL